MRTTAVLVLGLLLVGLAASPGWARLPAGYEDTDDPERLFRAGLHWKHNRDYSRAIEAYCRAIELDPDLMKAYNALAWVLSTAPKEQYRDGRLAVKLAERAVEADKDDYKYLDTLAAAYAEVGRMDEAVETQARVVELAGQRGRDAGEYRKRLEAYRRGEPWREP
jgi:tetratricopeptide (TPR) repeat protein